MVNTFWSILPPIIAIVLALLTKEVYSSLLVGLIAGALFYTNFNPLLSMNTMFDIMATKLGDNASIIIFLCLLGVVVVLMTKAGGSRAYGEWAKKNIKSKRGAMLATSALGVIIFVDDYFNCLTVGTVMGPVTDSHNVSRAKLAYIIDSTAAPICIIAPVSSWAVSVGSTIESTGIANGFSVFVQTIPFNFYAILTIVMIVLLALLNFDYGKMKKYQQKAVDNNPESQVKAETEIISEKGRVYDLIVPILVLIITTLGFMVLTGILNINTANAEGAGIPMDLSNIINECTLYNSMIMGAFLAIIVMLVMYLPRKLMTFSEFMKSIIEGIKSMVPAIVILALAWSLSGICSSDYLMTGDYVGGLIAKSGMTLKILPPIIFIVAALLAFATGTSWGTFGILIPIVVSIFAGSNNMQLLVITISATLAGAVLGDHVSPISDTTILSSAGARCNHIDHISTQIPYALTVAVCCFVGYIIAGFVGNWWLPLLAGLVLLLCAIFFLKHKSNKEDEIIKAQE